MLEFFKLTLFLILNNFKKKKSNAIGLSETFIKIWKREKTRVTPETLKLGYVYIMTAFL